MLIRSKEYAKLFEISIAWRNYAKAMNKRRPGSELNHNAFGKHVTRYTYAYISINGSALFGEFKNEIFCVSHFSPVSNRDMVNLLTKLSKDRSIKALFAVTEDLVLMLQKIGFVNLNQTIETYFRGEITTKFLLTN